MLADMDSAEPLKITIERARPEDAEGVFEVHYRTWLATYPNPKVGVTVDDVEARYADRSPERMTKRRERLMQPPEGTTTLIAREGAKVVGVCDVVAKSDRNQIAMIYVLPEQQRKGIGNMLWEEGKKYVDMTKDTYVEVADYNEQAINFYKKLGFVPTGRTFTDENYRLKSGAIIPEMEMVLKAE
jgi:ribosomal protein S18 acetylase RimI-like enzyme